jgi:hypothetical protein
MLPVLRSTLGIAVIVHFAVQNSRLKLVTVGKVDAFIGATSLEWSSSGKLKKAGAHENEERFAEVHFG